MQDDKPDTWPGIEKCDAHLRMSLDPEFAEPTEDETESFSLFIKVKTDKSEAKHSLLDLGVKLGTFIDSIGLATAHEVSRDLLRTLIAQDWVVRVEGSRQLFPTKK